MAHAVITLKDDYILVDASIRTASLDPHVVSVQSRTASFPWRAEPPTNLLADITKGERYCQALYKAVRFVVKNCPGVYSVEILETRF